MTAPSEDRLTDEDRFADSHYHISDDLVADIVTALENGDADMVLHIMQDLHAADQAELLNSLHEEQRAELVDMLNERFDYAILPELNADAAEQVLEQLGVDRYAEALTSLETDDAVHVIEELTQENQLELLEAMPVARRNELEEGLAYPEDSAGRLMTRKLVCAPAFWTVGNTIDRLRSPLETPSFFYVVYVVDPKFRPIGRVQLSHIMREPRETLLSDIMTDDVHAVGTHLDQEEVAFMFRKYALVETPVVNQQGRLVGTITVDDVVHVINEEEEEDYLRAGGVRIQDIHAGLSDTVRQRFPWLFINLLTAVAASLVVGLYSETIEQLVALAVLMPIVASMGGNAGTQSVTVAVRALATRQLKDSNAMMVLRKELFIGLLNGLGLAAIMGGGAYLWYQDIILAGVFVAATIFTIAVAGFSGAFIPIMLSKLKVDPAVSSGIFLTTITDIVGFFTFLGLAAAFIV